MLKPGESTHKAHKIYFVHHYNSDRSHDITVEADKFKKVEGGWIPDVPSYELNNVIDESNENNNGETSTFTFNQGGGNDEEPKQEECNYIGPFGILSFVDSSHEEGVAYLEGSPYVSAEFGNDVKESYAAAYTHTNSGDPVRVAIQSYNYGSQLSYNVLRNHIIQLANPPNCKITNASLDTYESTYEGIDYICVIKKSEGERCLWTVNNHLFFTIIEISQSEIDNTPKLRDSWLDLRAFYLGHPYQPKDCYGTPSGGSQGDGGGGGGSANCEKGCTQDGLCYEIGSRLSEGYCTSSGEFVEQKSPGSFCFNSYECSSNTCIAEKCISPGILQRFLGWLRDVF